MSSTKKSGGTGDQSVKGIYQSLEYGPAPESQGAFNAWLDDHGRKFGHFINNEWYDTGGKSYYTTTAPATGEKLADTIQGDKSDVEYAVSCARAAHSSWSQLAPHVRARYMYAIARNVAKHARLLAVCEAVDNGKTIRETRDADIPLVARWLYHYAGWAQLKDTEMSEWQSVGVIGGIVPWNFPLMLLVWKVAPALAMVSSSSSSSSSSSRCCCFVVQVAFCIVLFLLFIYPISARCSASSYILILYHHHLRRRRHHLLLLSRAIQLY
jgi:aldehyde dehydrogenase (NAD+)